MTGDVGELEQSHAKAQNAAAAAAKEPASLSPAEKRAAARDSDREYWKPHHDELLKDLQWRRRTRLAVSVLAAVMPAGLLGLLAAALTCAGEPGYLCDQRVGEWPKIAVISGAFLTFIFVFGGLVKGVFAISRGGHDEPAAPGRKVWELGQQLTENLRD